MNTFQANGKNYYIFVEGNDLQLLSMPGECNPAKYDELSKIDAPQCREGVDCPCRQIDLVIKDGYRNACDEMPKYNEMVVSDGDDRGTSEEYDQDKPQDEDILEYVKNNFQNAIPL